MKNNHGGKRNGAGRKKPKFQTITKSISMGANNWEKIDQLRGTLSRGRFLSNIIKEVKSGQGCDSM
jgi:hypothetical protein